MTTKKLSSERLLDASLWRNMTRRRFPHILVAFLCGFFTLVVPFLLMLPPILERTYYDLDAAATAAKRVTEAVGTVTGVMGLALFFSYVLAVYFGVITVGFMMRRRTAHFYHALPQKRETLYTTSTLSALFCAGIGLLPAVGIALIELSVYGFFCAPVLTAFFRYLAKCAIYFLLTYALTVFVGTVAGGGVVQVLLTGMAMFWPVLTYAALFAARSEFSYYLDFDYYLSESTSQWLCLPICTVTRFNEPLQIGLILVGLLIAAVLLLGGMQIYKHRKMENAEQTVVFPRLARVLLYLLLFLTTLGGGLFFYAVGYGIGWMIFGFLCGGLLGFMLYNTILYKTPKAMFRGFKGLLIFAAAFAVFFLVFCADIFRIERIVPDPAYAEVTVCGISFDDNRIDDPEALAALTAAVRTSVKEDTARDDVLFSTLPYDLDRSFGVQVVFHTKLGLPLARCYTFRKSNADAERFLQFFADDPRTDAHIRRTGEFFREMANGAAEASINLSVVYKDICYYDGECTDILTLFDTYYAELGQADYARLSTPSVGTIRLHSFYVNGEYIPLYSENLLLELPLYADMTETLALLKASVKLEEEWIEKTAEEYLGDAPAAVYDTAFAPAGWDSTDTRANCITGGQLYDLSSPIEKQTPENVSDERGYIEYEGIDYASRLLTVEEAKAVYAVYLETCGDSALSRIFVPVDRSCAASVEFYGSSDPKNGVYIDTVYVSFPRGYTPEGLLP